MEPYILFQDNHMAVVLKPAGMIVNSADSAKGQVTLQEWTEKEFKIQNLEFKIEDDNKYIVDGYNKLDEFYSRSGIVHRLDKETSGIILIAKNPQAFINLQRQFKNGTVKKTYTALVHGKLNKTEGEIDAPVGRLPWNRMRFGVLPEGRPAKTLYKVLAHKTAKDVKNPEEFSLVEVYPQTGRTHQIRVHFQHLGHPVVSDALYAGRKVGRADREKLPRHFLHASEITLLHPDTHAPLAFSAPLPEDLQTFLDSVSESVAP